MDMRIKQMNQLSRAERKPYNYLNKCTPDHPPLGGFMLIEQKQPILYSCGSVRGTELLKERVDDNDFELLMQQWIRATIQQRHHSTERKVFHLLR